MARRKQPSGQIEVAHGDRREKPGHRSEAAGEHQFVKFNNLADRLADFGSERLSAS